MYFHVIACQVFQRELSRLIADSENVISVTWLPQGLHETPNMLTQRMAKAIDAFLSDVDSGNVKHLPDAFLLCYGLCSNGTIGLEAKRVPIVIPKTDDCIALFLGSQGRYLELFNEHSGTYWLNNGWIETSFLPADDAIERRKAAYAEQYGDDNAEYLIEQEMQYLKNYHFCRYITSPVFLSAKNESAARSVADKWELEFIKEPGDLLLIKKLISGDWDENEFVICPPGYVTAAAYDGSKIRAVPAK